MRTSERRFWRALGRYSLRFSIFVSAGLVLSAITVLVIDHQFNKWHNSDEINHVKNLFSEFRNSSNNDNYESARLNLRNYDSASTLKVKWQTLENQGAGAPQWIFEKSIYNAEPQFIELEYELTNKDANPRKVTVRFVPTGSANWGIQEINVNLLKLRFSR